MELTAIKSFLRREKYISADTSRLIKYRGVSANNLLFIQHVLTSVYFVQTNGCTRTHAHANVDIKV